MDGDINEYQRALEILIKLEDKLRERAVPEEKWELLLTVGHRKIAQRVDIEEVLRVIERLCDLL